LSVSILKQVETYGIANIQMFLIYKKGSRASVAHACNPSYSAGRDEADGGLKPAWANSSRDLILKNPS
jgi:hypothetical protein